MVADRQNLRVRVWAARTLRRTRFPSFNCQRLPGTFMEKPDSVAREGRLASSGNAADPSVAIRSRFGPITFGEEDFATADHVIEKVAATESRLVPEAFAK